MPQMDVRGHVQIGHRKEIAMMIGQNIPNAKHRQMVKSGIIANGRVTTAVSIPLDTNFIDAVTI